MSKQQRLVLIISILASFVAFLDGSVINVALPAIARELGGGLVVQQWVVDAYLLTLGSLILVAGSVSDLFGRKRVLIAGLVGFLVSSLLCAVSPNGTFLILSRGLQGIAGAFLVPSSLALIIASFSGQAQGKAIGSWTAWTGIAFVVGPLVGGFLVDAASWRLIFAINVLPIAITLWLIRQLRQPQVSHKAKVDVLGAVLCAVGLGGPVYALIEQATHGWSNPLIYWPFILGLIAFATFIWHEQRASSPMLPLALFKVRNFSVGNLATTSVYAGLSVATFLISVFVQQVGKYSAMGAGIALLPVTIIMFMLSPYFGSLSGKYGPRLFMAIGPMLGGVAFLYMLFRTDSHVLYWSQLFPAIIVFGVGLSITVAPLTAAILGAVDRERAGIASAANNAVARIAGLLAIAALGVLTGSALDINGFHKGVGMTAALLIVGGLISAVGIQNPQPLPAPATSKANA